MRLPYRTPPLSLNKRMHWRTEHRIKGQIHDAVVTLCRAQRVPKGLDRVEVQLIYVPRDKRRRDTDNMQPVVKAVCDAVAGGHPKRPGYGVVVDDTPEFMARPEPVIADPDRDDPHLLVVLTEIPTEEA